MLASELFESTICPVCGCTPCNCTHIIKEGAEEITDVYRKVFKKNGKPVGEVGIDLEASPGNGDWYVKHYASGTDYSGYDTRQDAIDELKYMVSQGLDEQGVAEDSDPCWKGYKQIGMKKKSGKQVPNCVPEGTDVVPAANPEDTVSLDIPLLIRLLEYSREDAKTDMDLHNVAERLITLSAGGKTLSMNDYDTIIPGSSD